MGFYRLRCNACLPERDQHVCVVDEERTIPRCNAPTVPGDLTERG